MAPSSGNAAAGENLLEQMLQKNLSAFTISSPQASFKSNIASNADDAKSSTKGSVMTASPDSKVAPPLKQPMTGPETNQKSLGSLRVGLGSNGGSLSSSSTTKLPPHTIKHDNPNPAPVSPTKNKTVLGTAAGLKSAWNTVGTIASTSRELESINETDRAGPTTLSDASVPVASAQRFRSSASTSERLTHDSVPGTHPTPVPNNAVNADAGLGVLIGNIRVGYAPDATVAQVKSASMKLSQWAPSHRENINPKTGAPPSSLRVPATPAVRQLVSRHAQELLVSSTYTERPRSAFLTAIGRQVSSNAVNDSKTDPRRDQIPEWYVELQKKDPMPSRISSDAMLRRFEALKSFMEEKGWDKHQHTVYANSLMLKALAHHDLELLAGSFAAFERDVNPMPEPAKTSPFSSLKEPFGKPGIKAPQSSSGSVLKASSPEFRPAGQSTGPTFNIHPKHVWNPDSQSSGAANPQSPPFLALKDTSRESDAKPTASKGAARRKDSNPNTADKTSYSQEALLKLGEMYNNTPQTLPEPMKKDLSRFRKMSEDKSGPPSLNVEAPATAERDGLSFAAWPNPPGRFKAPARIRKLHLVNLPPNSTAASVLSLIWHGPIESINFNPGSTSAHVYFLSPDDCMRYYEAASNGIVIQGATDTKGKGKEHVVIVELASDPDPVGSILQDLIDHGATRCVRVIGVEEKWTRAQMETLAQLQGRKLEHVEIGLSPTGNRTVNFRFCNVQDAVRFKSALFRDEDWEHCNVQYVPDPCAKATGIH